MTHQDTTVKTMRPLRGRVRGDQVGPIAPSLMGKSRLDNAGTGPSAAPISAHHLKSLQFEPLDFIVGDIIPVGLTVLAGLPKVGKSWLALDIARSVALGTSCLEQAPQPKGYVLYLALEDSLRRLKTRLSGLMPNSGAWPRNLLFATGWPHAAEGGLEQLRNWIQDTPNARLIIIDVLQRYRSASDHQGNAFQRDYRDLESLQKLAQASGIGIILVHHLRKSSGRSDPFEQISGSTGLTAAADTLIKLDRDSDGIRLYASGKDIETVDMRVEFDKAAKCWRVVKQPEAASEFRERDMIIDLLRQQPGPMKPSDIAQALGKTSTAVRTMLSRMHHRRQITKHGRGDYSANAPHG
ncbi:AAA family ATPase [Bosea sp. (in: a-proteobacteria)]|uniref:AAA family ATPase n=1 Tax=Bosea sp. (in: a-proteobacteria) TaxID=1871050 RepID=UPI0035621382